MCVCNAHVDGAPKARLEMEVVDGLLLADESNAGTGGKRLREEPKDEF